jgi:hypothetical protein
MSVIRLFVKTTLPAPTKTIFKTRSFLVGPDKAKDGRAPGLIRLYPQVSQLYTLFRDLGREVAPEAVPSPFEPHLAAAGRYGGFVRLATHPDP